MNRRTDEGFVLRVRPLGEADLLVTLLTGESGRVQAVARTARKSRRRFGAALEPLTLVRAQWTESAGRELARLESCDILRSYVAAQRELAVFYFFAYVAEVAGLFARENEADPRFFRLVGAVLEACAAGLDVHAGRRYFDLWTLRLQGLLPDLAVCGGCGEDPAGSSAGAEAGGVMCLEEDRLLCARCAAEEAARGEKVRLPGRALRAARGAMRVTPGRASGLGGDGLESLDELSRRAMLRFTERPLRSLRFLTGAAS